MDKHDTASVAIRAQRALAELFFDELAYGPVTMWSFEDESIEGAGWRPGRWCNPSGIEVVYDN